MKYTKYFGLISRHQGQFDLHPSEFQRMMNIVHLEGIIFGLNRAKGTYKNTNLYHRYDNIISKYNNKLSDLTQSQTPELLLREMVRVVE